MSGSNTAFKQTSKANKTTTTHKEKYVLTITQLIEINSPWSVLVELLKDSLPLLYVVPQRLEFMEFDCATHIFVKHSWNKTI